MSEKLEENQKKQEITSSEVAEEFKKLIAEFKHKHQLNDYEIIDILLGQKTETKESIPTDCFNKKLGSLETIVKYLKENKNLTTKKIAELTGRTNSAIINTYNKTKQKMPEQMAPKSQILIPIHVLTNKKLSVLENISVYLKEEQNMKLREIGKLLQRSEKTIWTAYNRAKKR
jgi:hypothetical protein